MYVCMEHFSSINHMLYHKTCQWILKGWNHTKYYHWPQWKETRRQNRRKTGKLPSEWPLLSRVWLFATSWTIQSRNSPGQNTGVGSLSLLQGIFPIQGANQGLPQILYQLNYKGSPIILEWVAYPFSSGSSQSKNLTRVSCIAGGFFTNWAISEALCSNSATHSNQQLKKKSKGN